MAENNFYILCNTQNSLRTSNSPQFSQLSHLDFSPPSLYVKKLFYKLQLFTVCLNIESMGNSKLSSLKSIKSINQATIQDVSRLYHSKLFAKCKKSLRKFKFEISSVVKRLRYLEYGWSKTLCRELEAGNIDQLYAEYREVLKQNCIREGQNEIVFRSSKIKTVFLDHVNSNYQLQVNPLSPDRLKELICESKCFLMVLNWLSKIGTCNVSHEKPCSQEKVKFEHLYGDKAVFALLIDATAKTYKQYYSADDPHRKSDEQYIKNSHHPKDLLLELIHLKKKSKMHEKEESIRKIEEILIRDEKFLEKNIDLIRKTVESSQIFAHLLTIKEIGTLNVQFLWSSFHGNRFGTLFS